MQARLSLSLAAMLLLLPGAQAQENKLREQGEKASGIFDKNNKQPTDEDKELALLLEEAEKNEEQRDKRYMLIYNRDSRLPALKKQAQSQRDESAEHRNYALLGAGAAVASGVAGALGLWVHEPLFIAYGFASGSIHTGVFIANLILTIANWDKSSVEDKVKQIAGGVLMGVAAGLSFAFPYYAGIAFLIGLAATGLFSMIWQAVKSCNRSSEAAATEEKIKKIEKELRENPAV